MAAVQHILALPSPAAPVPSSARPKSIAGIVNEVEMTGMDDSINHHAQHQHQYHHHHQQRQQSQQHQLQQQPTTMENGATMFGSGPRRGDTRIVTIVYGQGQEGILSIFAEVLGQPFRLRPCFGEVGVTDQGWVVGIPASSATRDLSGRDRGLVVAINAHCVNLGMPPDANLSAGCDYEFLYTSSPFFRRDLARFISFTLGQINHHETLMAKPRTFMISTTFPDVRAALPNIDILTVGADAVELRVDLLREPLADGSDGYAAVPSLSYVGEQVMLLRQRTELPIIFTTRCTRENGRFPMDDPELYREYLYRAIQWGVEYIDVELWLPEEMRRFLFEKKGSSRIMSAFHDFSGTFKWPSTHAQSVFLESRRYADVIKMIAIINDHNENFELEYFRTKMRAEFPDSPPFSGVNMGETGQFSRTLNRVFTPITHPLLPIIAAPGQMSAAEINAALALVGQLPKKHMYGISGPAARSATPQAAFYEKCFNELGLPHNFAVVERRPIALAKGRHHHFGRGVFGISGAGGGDGGAVGGGGGGGGGVQDIEAWCNQKYFGGAYLNPAVPHQSLVANSAFFQSLNGGSGPALTEAARLIGMVDTIVVRPGAHGQASPSPASAPASIPSSPRQQPRHLAAADSSPSSSSAPSNGHKSNNSTSNSNSGGGGGGGSTGHHPAASMTAATAAYGLLPASTALVFDNASWRGILSTLTRDLAPSAYFGCSAVVLASSPDDAASAIFALKALKVGKLYTVGFKTPPALAGGLAVEPFNSLESLQRARADASTSSTSTSSPPAAADAAAAESRGAPFVVVSALGPEKSTLVGMLVRLFGSGGGGGGGGGDGGDQQQQQQQQQRRRKVFLDLADGSVPSAAAPRRTIDPAVIAEQSGFVAYGFADTAAFTTVETLRSLVGQNVPYSFVRLASGRVLY